MSSLYHMFIVFETKGWWWSIEKHSDGITIQRSKIRSAVQDRYRQKGRTSWCISGIDLLEKDEGRMSVYELINWLYKNKELQKKYDYMSSNCEHFGQAVFDHVAKTKSSSSSKTGAAWENKIYFDPEADKAGTGYDSITDEDLMTKLRELVGYDETIAYVCAYKAPLSAFQIKMSSLYHMFIVFEAKGWWWSIEKYSDGITIQRSKIRSAVQDHYRKKGRTSWCISGIDLLDKDEGKTSVYDLINWLYKNNELRKKYMSCNCQHFGQAVFNHVAKTTVL